MGEDLRKTLIVDILRTLAKGARRIKLHVYLPSDAVRLLRKAWSKKTLKESWSPVSVSKLLQFIADMIE